MSDEYLILSIVNNEAGVIKRMFNWEDAVDCAVKMASELDNIPESDIRAELEGDGNFLSVDGNIRVQIAQCDDD